MSFDVHHKGQVKPLVAAMLLAVSSMAAPAAFAGQAHLSGLQTDTQFDQFIVKYRSGTAERNSSAAIDRGLQRAAQGLARSKAGQAVALKHFRRMSLGADVIRANRALGRSDVFLKLEIIKKTYGVLILVASIVFFDDVLVIAAGSVLSTLIATFVNAAPNKKLLGYRYLEQVKDLLPSLGLTTLRSAPVFAPPPAAPQEHAAPGSYERTAVLPPGPPMSPRHSLPPQGGFGFGSPAGGSTDLGSWGSGFQPATSSYLGSPPTAGQPGQEACDQLLERCRLQLLGESRRCAGEGAGGR